MPEGSVRVGVLDDPIWQETPDETIPAKRRGSGRTKARPVIIGFLVVLLASGGVALRLSRSHRAPGDPGGHILQRLQPVARAVPSAATMNYKQFDEPQWDSWDGQAGTFGWSDVVAQIGFSWSGTASALVAYTNAELTRLGWNAYTATVENGVAGGSWSKTLTNGTEASAQLSIEPGGGSWTLEAQAPPRGPRAG